MTQLITRSDVRHALPMRECIDALERAFRAQGQGRVVAPRITGTHVDAGSFHVKTAGLLQPPVYAAKINANFPGNRARNGLPTVQGVVALFDATCGKLLALIDSGEITRLRTAAASALAARYLAREDASALTICGCGVQGRAHLEALMVVRPLRSVFAYDTTYEIAARFAAELSGNAGVDIEPVRTLADAACRSDMIAMCTPAREVLLHERDVRAGTFIAAVGADSEDKRELDPALLMKGAVIVDDLDQCRSIGELHHAPEAKVRGTLAALVAGDVRGRESDGEITIFDSTGTALEDVAAAALVLDSAVGKVVHLDD